MRPLLLSLYVSSHKNSILGYSYSSSNREYTVFLKGRSRRSSEPYEDYFERMTEFYGRYLNFTANYVLLWAETGDKSYFNQAVSTFWKTA
ncbi:hypothetical protein [Thermococcus sp.]